MLTDNQQEMAKTALRNILKATGVITPTAYPEWPMLITLAEEFIDHISEQAQKPADEPMDPQQIYKCDSGCIDQLVVYPGDIDPTIIAFVCESMTGQRDNKASVLLTHDDVRRLRNQLNQLLGE